MIQLTAQPRPAKLTDALVLKKTHEYNATKKSVWLMTYIVKTLLKMSHGKCAYCEQDITTESKYPEVEHFLPKSLFLLLVLDWFNLLPCCKYCNSHKNDHDPNVEPIVHPVRDNPKDHLKLSMPCLLKSKTELGKSTIRVLALNGQRIAKARSSIVTAMAHELDSLQYSAEKTSKQATISVSYKNDIADRLLRIMETGRPTKAYSATVSTAILTDDSYPIVKTILQNWQCWDADFQEIEKELEKIAFIEHPSV
jgi:uncharacterized protein (TIGR02646 family)